MDRREFVRCAMAAVVVVAAGSTTVEAAAPTSVTIKVRRTGTVAAITKTAYTCSSDRRFPRLFTRVGPLSGNLWYLVNGRFMFVPAVACIARVGDTITWRRV